MSDTSGDFSDQATTPQPIEMDNMILYASERALTAAEESALDWDTLPATLARIGIDMIVQDLIVFGHKDMTILDLGVELGIVHKDGSWT